MRQLTSEERIHLAAYVAVLLGVIVNERIGPDFDPAGRAPMEAFLLGWRMGVFAVVDAFADVPVDVAAERLIHAGDLDEKTRAVQEAIRLIEQRRREQRDGSA